jgi:diamine N-acetyltransferase
VKYVKERAKHPTVEDRGKPSFRPLDPATAKAMGFALASMDPWQTLGIRAASLSRLLLESDDHLHRRAICSAGTPVGVVAVRTPWLYGPYVALLAVLPEWQGMGIGSAALRRIEQETKPRPKNIWVCVSSFNADAKRFYERNAFEPAGTLPALLRPGFTELLMRKRIV